MIFKRRYREWAGEPFGTAEDGEHCVVEVPDRGRSVLSHQCGRKRGHGPEGLYCAQHALMLVKGWPLRVPEPETPERYVKRLERAASRWKAAGNVEKAAACERHAAQVRKHFNLNEE